MKKTYIIPIIIAVVFGIGWTVFQRQSGGITESKAPQVVELKNGESYELTASFVKKNIGGKSYKMLGYNGSIPGPTIKVMQGAEVTINLKNDTDTPSSLHAHGVRMDNPSDGVPGVTQKEIMPGEIFSYKLKFPDAGVFWYHPHVRVDYALELGLYGNFLVDPAIKVVDLNIPCGGCYTLKPNTNYWSPVNREVLLFIDDILIENGKIKLSKQTVDRTLMGRYGNIMLVNGETDYKLQAKKGEVVRFYITNSANTRPFNVAIKGAKMKLVGGDEGSYEKDAWVDSVFISPSERAIIEVLFDKTGSFAIENRTPAKTYKLGIVKVTSDVVSTSYATEFAQLRESKETVASIDPFRVFFDKSPDKRVTLSVDTMSASSAPHGGMSGQSAEHALPSDSTIGKGVGSDKIEWEDTNAMGNAMSNTDTVKWNIIDDASGKKNMDIDWKFKKGDKVKIRIFNDLKSAHPMPHPIHFHGQRFLVLERDGVKQTNLVWKDTVFVKTGETVDILLDASNVGTWMAHCHIAEHAEAGMMMKFDVI